MGLLRASTGTTVVIGAVSGAVASWVKVLVEAPMQVQAEKIWPPTAEEKLLVGADPAGHPEKMPPAVIATDLWRRVTGEQLDTATALKAQTVIHYAFGTGFGVVYALLARSLPAVTAGRGALAGAGLYGLTHASLIPASGFQPSPARLPRAAVAWEGGSHVVFGIADEAVRRLLTFTRR